MSQSQCFIYYRALGFPSMWRKATKKGDDLKPPIGATKNGSLSWDFPFATGHGSSSRLFSWPWPSLPRPNGTSNVFGRKKQQAMACWMVYYPQTNAGLTGFGCFKVLELTHVVVFTRLWFPWKVHLCAAKRTHRQCAAGHVLQNTNPTPQLSYENQPFFRSLKRKPTLASICLNHHSLDLHHIHHLVIMYINVLHMHDRGIEVGGAASSIVSKENIKPPVQEDSKFQNSAVFLRIWFKNQTTQCLQTTPGTFAKRCLLFTPVKAQRDHRSK